MYVFSCIVKLKIFEVFGQQSNITIYVFLLFIKFSHSSHQLYYSSEHINLLEIL